MPPRLVICVRSLRLFSALCAFALIGAGCGHAPTVPRYVPSPRREADLPSNPDALVLLADRIVRDHPNDLQALDRARSALYRAASAYRSRWEVHWRIARVCFLMAQQLQHTDQIVDRATEGMRQARQALRNEARRAPPHYYLALNMAKIAEATSKLGLIKQMVAEAQRAADIDPAFDRAGPLVFLGKVYLTAPAWPISIGDLDKAIRMLERAVEIAPEPTTRIFLGQALFEDGRKREAQQQLERALQDPRADQIEPKWRHEAESLLRQLRH